MSQNKYPIVDDQGNKITSSRWMNTETGIRIKCPKCGSDPGFYCETPKGRQAAGGPHWQRCKAYHDLPDFDVEKHTVRETTLEDIRRWD